MTPDPKSFPRAIGNPILYGLPPALKDPANFEKIQRAILNTLKGKCSHSEMLEMVKCGKCTRKMMERRLLLKRLGFRNPAQYLEWKKVHVRIKELYQNVDFSRLK